MDTRPPTRPAIATLIAELAARLGEPRFVAVCVRLLEGAPREEHLDELRSLSGHDDLDAARWPDDWVRTWGARGLLHVWGAAASEAVVAGLRDPHWRPAEMCLKVAARHEVAGAGDGAGALAGHELARVRAQAMRALAVCGDTEHVDPVRAALDDPDEAVRRHAARALERLTERLDLA